MTFYVFSRILNLQIHAHIYKSFIRHHKMLGVRIAKTENRASKARKPLRHKTLLLHLFCQHPTENSGNRMISTVFATFKKSFDPHKSRLYLTPKAFFFDAFQKLPSGNTGPTHTVTHTTNCAERAKEHRRGGFAFSPVFLFFSAYMTCAMKLPIVCAASSCFCLVAWV